MYFCIFSTRIECSFASSPLVSSVVFRPYFPLTRNFPLRSRSVQRPPRRKHCCLVQHSQRFEKLHSKRVGKMKNYTRNEWGKWKATLETSGEDEKLHSKRGEKMKSHTRNVLERPQTHRNYLHAKFPLWQMLETTLETSGEQGYWCNLVIDIANLCLTGLEESLRTLKYIFSARFECSPTSSTLVSSVVSHLLHSFRV